VALVVGIYNVMLAHRYIICTTYVADVKLSDVLYALSYYAEFIIVLAISMRCQWCRMYCLSVSAPRHPPYVLPQTYNVPLIA